MRLTSSTDKYYPPPSSKIGDVAILIDLHNVEELFYATQTMLLSDDLQLQLGKESLERAELFPWKGTAQETPAASREVCQ